ncbi:MAG: PEGA domain-containing protein [Phycisphaerae bacterium]|nr:PEGA domain-containing protein [Tepidisphaeraceae bacterium]
MPPRLPLAVVLSLLCAGVSGCASYSGGEGATQRVFIGSTPPGAGVAVDGVPCGVTPTRVDLDRAAEHDLRLTLAGYEPHDRRLRPGVRAGFYGNLLLLGGAPVGMLFDVLGGGWKGFDGEISVELVRLRR